MNRWNRSAAFAWFVASIAGASAVAAAESKAASLTTHDANNTVPVRLALTTKLDVPKPVACELEDAAAKAEHVLIRIGRIGNTLVIVPMACKVAADAVVTWVPDTTLSEVEIRFVTPGPNNSCTGATKGKTPDAGSNTVFSPPSGPATGPVLPISFTVSDKPPAGSSFSYCVSTAGGMVTPNPAIIIKPD